MILTQEGAIGRTVNGRTGADREILLNLLNEVLATEIISVLRYQERESMAKKIMADSTAAEFKALCQEAQVHVDQIAERITQLEGAPNFTPVGRLMKNHSEYIEGNTLQEGVKGDWVLMRVAIDSYLETIRVLNGNDPLTHRMLEKILATKKEHADRLINFIAPLDSRKTADTYQQSKSMVSEGGHL